MILRSIRLPILIFLKVLGRNKKWVISGVALIFAVAVLQFQFHVFSSRNTVRIGLIGTYKENDLPQEVTKLISSSLVEVNNEGKVKPNLVSGWEVNNDATEFKLKLRNDLKWSDNSILKSSDISFNIPNVSISFPGDHIVQLKLKEPYSPLPSLLIKPIFKKGTLLGTGSYTITRIEKSRIFITKIILESSNPSFPNITLRFYPNEKVAVTGFDLGEVQVLMGLNNLKLIPKNHLIGIKQQTDYSKIVTILFQTEDSLLKNRSVRQALAFKAPKIPGEELADNPYPPNLWVYNSDSKKYLSNPEEAKAALERAKPQLAEDALSAEFILTATPNLEGVGKIVAEAWRDLGFNVKMRLESGVPQNFQALLITQSIPVDPDQYFLWHATQTKTNLTRYDSKRADKDLEDGRKIIKEEERKLKYLDFQKTLLEDAPATFLYFPKYNIVYLKKTEKALNQILNLN